MRRALLLMAVCAACVATGPARAQDQPGPALAVNDLSVPLRAGEFHLGDIPVTLEPGGRVLVPADALIGLLEGVVAPEILASLRDNAEGGFLSSAAAERAGLAMRLDLALLELQLSIPAELREASVVSLRGGAPPRSDLLDENAGVSAFANLIAVAGHASGAGPLGEDATGLAVDGAARLFGGRGPVLEAAGFLGTGAESPLQRDFTRLVQDDPERAVRYTAGDLLYPVAGFQRFQPGIGLSVAREFSLQPQRRFVPTGHQHFVLERPSRVEVFLNGQLVRTLRLAAGPHDLRDFPFYDGVNDVELRIEDDAGRRETLRFSSFFSGILLEEGEGQFGAAAGFAASESLEQLDYHADRPFLSVFHRHGLSPVLTMGMNAQAESSRQMLGGEAIWAGPLGLFDLDLGASHDGKGGVDHAAALGYEHRFRASPDAADRVLDLSIASFGNGFEGIGVERAFNNSPLELGARYSQDLAWNARGSLGLGYALAGMDQGDRFTADAFVGKPLTGRLFAGLSLGVDRDELRSYLSLTYRLGTDQTVTAAFDSRAGTTRVDWEKAAPDRAGSVAAALGAELSSDRPELSGGLSYLGNRFELGVDHETVFADSDSARGEHDTRLRLGSALGLADGTLALGRPIREGFAIVTAHPSLDGRRVYVDPDADGKAVAHSDGLGPALVPDLRAYWRNDLPLEVEDLPPGYDLGSARLEVMPAYRGGRRLEVGSNAFITSLGILADPSGAPLAYASGELISLDDPGFAPAVLFTNKTGRFAASGLKPGRYEIRLNTAPPRTATFSIPEESASLHQAGTILASDQQPL